MIELDAQANDLDDVEGHGLVEIAAGLGVAAVVAGGAAGVTQLASSSTTGGPTHDPVGTVVATLDKATTATADHGRGFVVVQKVESTAAEAQQTLSQRPATHVDPGALTTVTAVSQQVLTTAEHKVARVTDEVVEKTLPPPPPVVR